MSASVSSSTATPPPAEFRGGPPSGINRWHGRSRAILDAGTRASAVAGEGQRHGRPFAQRRAGRPRPRSALQPHALAAHGICRSRAPARACGGRGRRAGCRPDRRRRTPRIGRGWAWQSESDMSSHAAISAWFRRICPRSPRPRRRALLQEALVGAVLAIARAPGRGCAAGSGPQARAAGRRESAAQRLWLSRRRGAWSTAPGAGPAARRTGAAGRVSVELRERSQSIQPMSCCSAARQTGRRARVAGSRCPRRAQAGRRATRATPGRRRRRSRPPRGGPSRRQRSPVAARLPAPGRPLLPRAVARDAPGDPAAHCARIVLTSTAGALGTLRPAASCARAASSSSTGCSVPPGVGCGLRPRRRAAQPGSGGAWRRRPRGRRADGGPGRDAPCRMPT